MEGARASIVFLTVVVLVLFSAAFVYYFLSEAPRLTEYALEMPEKATAGAAASTASTGNLHQPAQEKPFMAEFSKLTPYAEGHVYKLAWADFDSNGFPDLAIANYNRQNYLFINRGGSSFDRTPQFGSGYSIDIKWLDQDNDGMLDIVVLRNKQKSSVYFSNGDSSFTESLVFEQGHTRAMAVDDFDNDGFADIFVGHDDEPSYLYVNDRNRGFGKRIIKTGWHITSLDSCDIDSDGLNDIVVGTDFQQNYLLVNNGDSTFTVSPQFGEKDHTRDVACVDLNNDGLPDVITGNDNQASNEERNFIYVNNGNFDFTKTQALGASRTYSIDTADFNSDGLVDVAVGNYDQPSYIYINRGDFRFERLSTVVEQDYLRDIKAVDINSDGLVDISTALDKNGLNILLRKA